ncbi:MAG: type II toxin-antitoxin system VapC family toxin [Dongiaceae bacterium]
MILIDANLLVYAHISTTPQHAGARAWLDGKLNGAAPVGLPWPSLLTFVRLVSNPRIFANPPTMRQAWRQVEAWLDCAPVWIPLPTERHREELQGIVMETSMSANHVPDAHLAALAKEHGLTLCSTDGGFARFPGLRWENPLRASTRP